MTLTSTIYLLIGLPLCIFWLMVLIASVREHRPRAAAVSGLVFVLCVGLWYATAFLLNLPDFLYLSASTVVVVFAILFFAPIGRVRKLRFRPSDEQVDERDTLFAREEYTPGTEQYDAYYSDKPQLKQLDDRLRRLPRLFAEGGRYSDPVKSPAAKVLMNAVRQHLSEVDGPVASDPLPVDSRIMTGVVKELTLRLGADEAGIAPMEQRYVYSHVGRGPNPWGAPIKNSHRFAIVFTVEMDYRAVESAPRLAITEETALQYNRAAQISIALARFVRDLGYPARAHISGSNYQVMLPPLGYLAGLGELGRMGYLISPRFGGRIRLGAVTTDLPLDCDRPISFGVQDFCDHCLKCAHNCPSAAIDKGSAALVRGVEKWQLNSEQCLHAWRTLGTDCGLCMKVCPFSHPPTIAHNLIRAGIKRSAIARRISVWGDDLLYGRRVTQ